MTSYLTDYTHFKNKAELDEATRKHRKWNWNKMNATDHDVLEMIWRHSIKFGAAQLAYDAIALEIIKANSTVRRSIRKLEQLGILDRHHYIRPGTNGLGANIYSIRPFNDYPSVVDERFFP
jgi:predicted transcriptional regulator